LDYLYSLHVIVPTPDYYRRITIHTGFDRINFILRLTRYDPFALDLDKNAETNDDANGTAMVNLPLPLPKISNLTAPLLEMR
jgi:hypothetical protein